MATINQRSCYIIEMRNNQQPLAESGGQPVPLLSEFITI